MCACCDDGGIDFVDILSNLRGGAGRYLLDVFYGVLLVARVDALRTVAAIEVDIHLEPADFFDDRDALVFRDAWIDGGLVNDNVAFADDFTDGRTGAVEWRKVGIVVGINRCGNGYYVEVAVADVIE